MDRDAEILERVQQQRAANNVRWVDLLRLALRVAPAEARALLADLATGDQAVVDLTRQLAKEPATLDGFDDADVGNRVDRAVALVNPNWLGADGRGVREWAELYESTTAADRYLLVSCRDEPDEPRLLLSGDGEGLRVLEDSGWVRMVPFVDVLQWTIVPRWPTPPELA